MKYHSDKHNLYFLIEVSEQLLNVESLLFNVHESCMLRLISTYMEIYLKKTKYISSRLAFISGVPPYRGTFGSLIFTLRRCCLLTRWATVAAPSRSWSGGARSRSRPPTWGTAPAGAAVDSGSSTVSRHKMGQLWTVEVPR